MFILYTIYFWWDGIAAARSFFIPFVCIFDLIVLLLRVDWEFLCVFFCVVVPSFLPSYYIPPPVCVSVLALLLYSIVGSRAESEWQATSEFFQAQDFLFFLMGKAIFVFLSLSLSLSLSLFPLYLYTYKRRKSFLLFLIYFEIGQMLIGLRVLLEDARGGHISRPVGKTVQQ